MIPELGQFALIIALALAGCQAVLPLVGAQRDNPALMAVARPAAAGQFAFVLLAFAALAYSFLVNDFSVENVARNSFSELPWYYRLTATWGSHEGSMLLWVLILAGWSVALALRARALPAALRARVLGVMGLISTGFLAFVLFTSNPFTRLLPAAFEGNDLNPLLQDWGMILHPPMLYMGYVGFSVSFALACAALLGGQPDAAWARWARPWATLAWAFLTLGIALGSWWAYRELGWGGWWFWDPTENASFMPWLAGTALIHSLTVTEKRGAFRAWTLLLALTTFSLSLLGAFLVRSGVLSSVHAFATDPARGAYILGFLAVTIGGSLALFAWRAGRHDTSATFAGVSRESLLLLNNLFLMAALGSVLLGTLYPLVMDALGLGKISVGPPYFDAVFVPLIMPALLLMAVGPLASWQRAAVRALLVRLRLPLAGALVGALALPLLMGRGDGWASAGFFLATWIALGTLRAAHEALAGAAGGRTTLRRRFARRPRRFWGGLLAHFGVALAVAAITALARYPLELDVRMSAGTSATLAGYTLRFEGTTAVAGPNYQAVRATIRVARDGRELGTLHPEKRTYNASGTTMTEAALRANARGSDLYVSLGNPLEDGAWLVRLYDKPLINWLWLAGLLIVAGGLLAASGRDQPAAVRHTPPSEV